MPLKRTKRIELFIPGTPRGKGRPRHTKSGHSYTPVSTREYEAKIRSVFQEQYHGYPEDTNVDSSSIGSDLHGLFQKAPLKLTVDARFSIPKSWSKKKRADAAAGLVPCTKRPDWDNIGKMTDALNELAWADDAQIIDGRVVKSYTDGEEGVLITIEEISDEYDEDYI